MLFKKRKSKVSTDLICLEEYTGLKGKVLADSVDFLIEFYPELEEAFPYSSHVGDFENGIEYYYTNYEMGYGELILFLEFIGYKLTLKEKSELYKQWFDLKFELEMQNYKK